MDILRTAALSPWGAAALICAVAAVAAPWLRRRWRTVTAAAAAAAAVAFAWAALDSAIPEARQAAVRAGADAQLAAARDAMRGGYNLDAAAALDEAEAGYRASDSARGTALVAVARGDLERIQGRLEAARIQYAVAAVRMRDVAPGAAARALIGLAQVTAAHGDVEVGAAFANEAVSLLRSADRENLLPEALLAGGMLARRTGALGRASDRLNEAEALFAEAGRPVGQARALLELARIERDLVRAGAANGLARRAAELFEAAEVPFGIILTDIVVGWGASDNEQPEPAVAAFRSARARLDGFADPLAEAARFLGLSQSGTLQVRPADGRTSARNSVAAADNLAAFPDHHIEARMLIEWARTEFELGVIRAGRDQ